MEHDQQAKPGQALRPRARILKTLGEELISSETVAVIELVKNAYDADASCVTVAFIGSLTKGVGGIEVIDDGFGMDATTVRTAWMEPATSVKKSQSLSAYLRRRVLGEKGVGRFASARLAEELELISRRAFSTSEVYAYFDWTQFDDPNKFLDEVLILIEERLPQEFKGAGSVARDILPRDGSHGTVLRMSKLKRDWGEGEVNSLRRGLSRLVSPFHDTREFRIMLRLPGTAEVSFEIEPPEIIKYPHYSLEGKLQVDGALSIKMAIHATGASQNVTGWLRRQKVGRKALVFSEQDTHSDDEHAPVCGPLAFRLLVWDRDQLEGIEERLGIGLRDIRRDLDAVAGVSIYRDGFRVLPYGEPENDWLRLDLRRVQNPTLRLSNNQLTGYVRISADTNPELKDQSNREGLDSNQAYADLQDVLLHVLARLEAERALEKDRTRRSTHPRMTGSGLFDLPDVEPVRDKLKAAHAGADALSAFDEATRAWSQQIVRIQDVLSRYRTLATLGQLIDKVVHDTRQPLSTIQGQSQLAQEAMENWLSDNAASRDAPFMRKVESRVSQVRTAADVIDAAIKRVEPLGGRRRGRTKKFYLEDIVKAAFAHFKQDIETMGIDVSIPTNLHLIQVDAAELQEVFINLISNSTHWLAGVPKDQRRIVVECSRPNPGEVVVIFADSGPGVPMKNREAIFEPYFTTKENGVGLGLVIAGEIVRDYYGGSLELMNSGPLGGAVFKITLRARI